jgi:inosose dehydratase
MKAAINVWTWGFGRKQDVEQALKEVSDIGYRYVENIYSVCDTLPDKAEFDALLARYGLEFVCGYFHLTGDDAADDARAERCVSFLQQQHVPLMNVQAAGRPTGGVTERDLAHTVARITKISELARQAGVTPCLHPHYGTMVEQATELAYVAEHIDSKLLRLTIDTAHTVLGGMDPVATFAQYASRVSYVHMKDIGLTRDPTQPWWTGFRELGRGCVDFAGVVAELKKVGYDGYLCVELDRPRVCGYKSAAISRQYLNEELGL